MSANGGFESVSVDLDAVQDDFERTVQTIADGVRGGVFPANPGPSGRDEPRNCSYCDFKRICPADKQALWGRKSGSPQAAGYAALAAGAGEDAGESEEDAA